MSTPLLRGFGSPKFYTPLYRWTSHTPWSSLCSFPDSSSLSVTTDNSNKVPYTFSFTSTSFDSFLVVRSFSRVLTSLENLSNRFSSLSLTRPRFLHTRLPSSQCYHLRFCSSRPLPVSSVLLPSGYLRVPVVCHQL